MRQRKSPAPRHGVHRAALPRELQGDQVIPRAGPLAALRAIVDGWDIDSTVVPTEIKNARADLAVRALTAELNADQTRAVIREKVGPGIQRAQPARDALRLVDQALGPFLRGGWRERAPCPRMTTAQRSTALCHDRSQRADRDAHTASQWGL